MILGLLPPVERLLGVAIPCAGAAAGFNAALLAWQCAGKAFRVSCATPVAGSLLGGVAVASASVLAAQVAFALESIVEEGNGKSRKRKMPSVGDLVLHAAVGMVLFKILGGHYRNVMPSSLSHPGALSRYSVPARGSRYAGDVEAQLVRDLFSKYGCHHCGSYKGTSIADHMPPNVVMKNKVAEKLRILKKFNFSLAKHVFNMVHKLELQRFYPQCEACMRKQGGALRQGKNELVYHFRVGFPEPPYLTGFFLSALKLEDNNQGTDKK
ncbi:uncharacterized protein LOC112341759 [Selaginella moellendorffii]|uniref:uncharacterized protein LOC112341759 n=1 Tax=Selaginella moellendorffii TaxID=88036 RepID=UPI000D1C28E7|nr:uncharacterized protein LOC112341759 [Selaginella moellendorffii]|eukprot:XP_024518152.1 uncharacterized protein LOC112341759 [Selaginella moellendorffii]